MRTIKVAAIALFLLIFLLLTFLELVILASGLSLSMENYFLWLGFVFWLYLIFFYHLNVSISLHTALLLFVIGILFGEFLLRLALTIWILGVLQSFLSYKKDKNG
ncbi:hypothetical protein A2115_03030 [Candidatus Woesebacteria bacterium GWA1_41_8]|uniref:Uncharacterized protein n=1 Tax=Candidatus Woesebacteria bacterium GWA1_41_8 TaxID=1802471 RepID=A0A1F7WHY9_9BACT|nr:MAG: hypothetical protein A2115_03030 [Candidatus Woesebacteria bacterium GWA1_41_8]